MHGFRKAYKFYGIFPSITQLIGKRKKNATKMTKKCKETTDRMQNCNQQIMLGIGVKIFTATVK